MLKLVLASNNAHKLAELSTLFAGLPVKLQSQADWGVSEPDEPHATFVENALVKARQTSAATGLAAIADDSGLCVPALGGEPGVQSAVYAADVSFSDGLSREQRRKIQDAANNQLLLQRLAALPAAQETEYSARFVCTLVAVRHANDPEPLIATGRWTGVLRHQALGSGGFGYDPLLFMPEFGCTVAQMTADMKNVHSHRARAAAAMRELMASAWWGH
jgi:XTP/dITP diphosphohydrolase